MSPREAEAVAVAADALDGAGDPAALVVALVAELARRGRLSGRDEQVMLARAIDKLLSLRLASRPRGLRVALQVPR